MQNPRWNGNEKLPKTNISKNSRKSVLKIPLKETLVHFGMDRRWADGQPSATVTRRHAAPPSPPAAKESETYAAPLAAIEEMNLLSGV